MRIRSRRRRPTVQLEDASTAETDRPVRQVADVGPSPEEIYSSSELSLLVRQEVARMPLLLREPLMLRDFEQLPIEVVAKRLHVSIPAAKSRILRARAELRKRLESHPGGPPKFSPA